MKNISGNKNSAKTRRVIARGGLTIIASFFILLNPFRSVGKKKPEKAKMLTEDGQLIEIDATLLAAARSRKKATDNELQQFVKK